MLKKSRVTIYVMSSDLQIANLDRPVGNVKYAGYEFNSTSKKLKFLYCKDKSKG